MGEFQGWERAENDYDVSKGIARPNLSFERDFRVFFCCFSPSQSLIVRDENVFCESCKTILFYHNIKFALCTTRELKNVDFSLYVCGISYFPSELASAV